MALRRLCGVGLLLQPEEVGTPSQTILPRSHPLVAASTRRLDADVEDLLLVEGLHPAEVRGEVAAVADVLQARIAAATESLPTQGACRRASRAVIA